MKIGIPPRHRGTVRLLIQAAMLAAFFRLAVLTRYPLGAGARGDLFFRADPYLGLTSFLSGRDFSGLAAFWPALLLLILTVWGKRFFCWYLCPLGAAADLGRLVAMRRRWGRGLSPKNRLSLQFFMLAGLLALAAFGFAGPAQFFDPLVITFRAAVSRTGLLVFSLLVFLLGVVLPRYWCFNLCPLGAMLELAARLRGRRGRFLPVDVSRRRFLGGAAGGAAAAAALGLGVAKEPDPRLLRPPGARAEKEFNARCIRCGRCLKVCPTGGLRTSFLEGGFAALGTPRLVPVIGACELCFSCAPACPTGAIRPVGPLGFRIGTARIYRDRCIAWRFGAICLICMEHCPALAIASDDRHRPSMIEENCIGCGICENKCPVEGEKAIVVFRKGERRS